MRIFFFITFLTSLALHAKCQTLRQIKVSKEERDQGAFRKFHWSDAGGYGYVGLLLMNDGTFSYSTGICFSHRHCTGNWTLSRGILTLKSTLQKNNIPVILSAEEGRHFANGSVIALVENQEKKLLQDVIISVNEDSIKCLPAMEMYNEKIGKIHRVKVGFENGMSSEWISIPNGQQCIALTVLNNDDISNYFILDNQRFRWKGKYLIPQQ